MAREKYAQLAPLTLAIGSALAVSSTQAAVITVDTLADPGGGTECSLRSAIIAVNTQAAVDGCPDPSDPADDLIQFAEGLSGSIELDGSALEITESVTIAGPGPGQLSIDAMGNSSVFLVTGGEADISGLTITNGDAKYGGGVLAYGQVSLRLSDCVISGNSASSVGGGLIVSADEANVENCDITDNVAGIYGGGIAVLGGEVTVQNSSISSNESTDIGGGLWVDSIESDGGPGPLDLRQLGGNNNVRGDSLNPMLLRIENSLVSGNTSTLGGGVGAGRNPTIIVRDAMERERPLGGNPAPNGSNLVVQGSVISGNTAERGGGIGLNGYLDFDSGPNGGSQSWVYNIVEITDSEISGNTALESGGGIASRSSDLVLYQSSVYDNTAYDVGGGIYSASLPTLLLGEPDSVRGMRAPGFTYLSGSSVNGNEVYGLILGGGGGVQAGGGGIASVSTPVAIVYSQINDNFSPSGAGGLLIVDDTLTVFESQVSGNIGGGVSAEGVDLLSVGSDFSGNTGGAFGGVLCVDSPGCEFKYSSVSENQGFLVGGIASDFENVVPFAELRDRLPARGRGIPGPVDPTPVRVFNSTVSSNVGGAVGGIYANVLSLEHATVAFNQQEFADAARGTAEAGGVVTNQSDSLITHSIIAGNLSSGGPDDLLVTDNNIAMDYGLIGGDVGFTPVGSGNLLNTNPQLQALALNGATITLTHAIDSDSPAFNAGDPALAAPTTDQRGASFPRVVAGVIDIGAYELLLDELFNDRFESPPP